MTVEFMMSEICSSSTKESCPFKQGTIDLDFPTPAPAIPLGEWGRVSHFFTSLFLTALRLFILSPGKAKGHAKSQTF
jgi:hypothetical protein